MEGICRKRMEGRREWKEYVGEKEKHEFFMPNVSSEEELKERLMQLIEWAKKNIKD